MGAKVKQVWASLRTFMPWLPGLCLLVAIGISITSFQYPGFVARGAPPSAARYLIAQPPHIDGGPVLSVETEVDDSDIPGRNRSSCTGLSRSWISSQSNELVSIVAISCLDTGSAQQVQYSVEQQWEKQYGPTAVTPPVPYAFEGIGTAPRGLPPANSQVLLFRRGTVVITESATVADSLTTDVATLLAQLATGESLVATGQPGPGGRPVATGMTLAGLSSGIGGFGFMYIIWSTGGAIRSLRRKYLLARPHPALSWDRTGTVFFSDVDVEGRRLVFRECVRCSLRWLAIFLYAYAVAPRSSSDSRATEFALASGLLFMSAYLRRTAFDRRHRLPQPVSPGMGRIPLSAAALFAGCVVATILAVASIEISVQLVNLIASQFPELGVRFVPAGPGGGLVETLEFGLPVSVLACDAAVVALLAVLAATWSYRASRSLVAEALRRLNEADARPPVVLFRSQEMLEATLRTTSFSREPWLMRATAAQVESFEDFLIPLLRRYGPVIAVNPPKRKLLPAPGATTVDLGQWQPEAKALVLGARLVVTASLSDNSSELLVLQFYFVI